MPGGEVEGKIFVMCVVCGGWWLGAGDQPPERPPLHPQS